MTLNEKLAFVQKHLKAPKNQFNKFGGYKFRSCEDILTGLKEVMPDDCTVIMSDDFVAIGDKMYCKATATFRYKDESLSVTAMARESMNQKGMSDGQCSGASSSYARKYALNGLFAIDDSKDSDSNEHNPNTNDKPADRPALKLSPSPEAEVVVIVKSIIEAFKDDNYPHAQDILDDIPDNMKRKVWGALSAGVKKWIKDNKAKGGGE